MTWKAERYVSSRENVDGVPSVIIAKGYHNAMIRVCGTIGWDNDRDEVIGLANTITHLLNEWETNHGVAVAVGPQSPAQGGAADPADRKRK